MVSSGAEKTRGRTGAGTHLGTGFRACLARERGRGDPSGLLGLRSAGHARSHDHAGRAAGGPLAGNPAPATSIRAAASPGRERAGEREGCRAHVADTRARSRVRSMRGPSRYVSEQTPSRKVAYHRARAGITASPRPCTSRVFFPETRELSLLRSGEMRLLFPKGTCELRTFSGRFRTTMRRCEARDGSEDSCARQCARVCLAIRRDAPVFTPKPAWKFRCFS